MVVHGLREQRDTTKDINSLKRKKKEIDYEKDERAFHVDGETRASTKDDRSKIALQRPKKKKQGKVIKKSTKDIKNRKNLIFSKYREACKFLLNRV